MRSLILFLILGSIAHAGPLAQQTFLIRRGDSQQKVKESLGMPSQFQPATTPGGEHWIYQNQEDICIVSFLEEKVVSKACQPNNSPAPKQVSTGRKVLRGIGMVLQGMGQARSNRINCTSSQSLGTVYTECN